MVAYIDLVRNEVCLWRVGRVLRAWLACGGSDDWLWERFVVELVPLIARFYRGTKGFEDVCSEVLMVLWRHFRARGWSSYRFYSDHHLGNVLRVAVRRILRDYCRSRMRSREVLGPFEVRRLVVSVPTVVSIRMAVRELPEIAYRRALRHNRWGYDNEALKLAIRFCLDGVKRRSDWRLFSNWFCVSDVAHLRSFAMLMVRWAMSDCFSRGIVYEEVEVSECVS